MRGRIAEQIVLGVSALVLAVVGVGSAVAPAGFFASFGIVVGEGPLAGELRATGAALVLLGVVIAAGVLRRAAAFPAAVVAAAVMLGYAAGRALSAAVDGPPAGAALAAGAVELALGAAATWVAVRTRPRGTRPRGSHPV